MQIPFVGGAYTARSSNLNAQSCINYFPVIDNQGAKNVVALYGTPGLDLFTELNLGSGQKVRATWVIGTMMYAVVNANVYSITIGKVVTLLGTITTSTGYVSMADNGLQVIIVDGTNKGYIITILDGTMQQITDGDFVAACSVTFQDGFFIVVETGTRRFYTSTLYDGLTWDAADVATVEGRSSNLMRCISNIQDLWFFGELATEVYYNSGDAFPFSRVSGALIDIGCGAIGTPCRVNGLMYWLTNEGKVCQNSGYTQVSFISTPEIEYQISTYSVIDDAVGFTCTVDGHSWYILAFPTQNKTWVYDITTSFWFEWQSYVALASNWQRHKSNCAAQFGRHWIIGDYGDGCLYTLSMTTYADNLQPIRRERTAQVIAKEQHYLLFHSLEIDFEIGVGLSGSLASITANMTGDAVSSFTIVSGGSGYTTAPQIRFTGGGGSGAVATATVAGGLVTNITLLNGGSGYTSAPTVLVVGGSLDPQAMLSWSDDGGHTWSNDHWKSIGKIGEYTKRVKWNRLGKSRNRNFRVVVSDSVKVAILGASANIEECKA